MYQFKSPLLDPSCLLKVPLNANIVKQDSLGNKKTVFEVLWSKVWKGGFQLMQILDLLGMHFDAVEVQVKTFLIFRLVLVILWYFYPQKNEFKILMIFLTNQIAGAKIVSLIPNNHATYLILFQNFFPPRYYHQVFPLSWISNTLLNLQIWTFSKKLSVHQKLNINQVCEQNVLLCKKGNGITYAFFCKFQKPLRFWFYKMFQKIWILWNTQKQIRRKKKYFLENLCKLFLELRSKICLFCSMNSWDLFFQITFIIKWSICEKNSNNSDFQFDRIVAFKFLACSV